MGVSTSKMYDDSPPNICPICYEPGWAVAQDEGNSVCANGHLFHYHRMGREYVGLVNGPGPSFCDICRHTDNKIR
jgi:hypothetical protein